VDETGEEALSHANLALQQGRHSRRADARQLASQLLHDFRSAKQYGVGRQVTERVVTGKFG
jgi:hypothetical protein